MKNDIPSLGEDNSGTYASTGKMEPTKEDRPDFGKMADAIYIKQMQSNFSKEMKMVYSGRKDYIISSEQH